jgi:polysaccharide biosynthesis/export protein
MTDPRSRSLQLPAIARKAARRFGALAGVALLAFAIQAQADSRETLGAGDSIRVTVFRDPDLTTQTRMSERDTILFPLIGEVALVGHTRH